MPNDSLLQAALKAARSGDKDTAAVLFARLVKEQPESEQGWLGLGFCFADKKRREFCLRRVLEINPNNIQAKQSLDLLQRPVPPALPATRLAPPPVSAADPKRSNTTPAPAFSSLTMDEPLLSGTDEPAFLQTMKQKPGYQEPPPPVEPEKPAETTAEVPPAAKAKKRPAFRRVIVWIILLPLLLCLAGAGYLGFTGRLGTLLQAAPAPISTYIRFAMPTDTPLPTASPTQTATPAPTASPTATLSPTPANPTATPFPTARPTLAYTPLFAKTACRFAAPEKVTVTCGYVSVPEDRTNPRTQTIQLAVAVFHSTSPNPAPDPVVFLQGGPGGEAVLLSAGNFDLLVNPFLSRRDYIAFDQRGTGISIPALGCEELEKVYKQDINGQIPASSRDFIYTNAFRSCHGAMTVGGIDLNSYTTLESSADLKDIVTALGYKQVNLFGASYGTRLALVTMRDHPEIVRSAVLDSVVPVETKLFNEDPVRYGSALQALFDGCNNDLKCNAAYPNLQSVFWDLVDQLDAKPVRVSAPVVVGSNTEVVDGADLMGIILSLLKSTRGIGYAPGIIYKIKGGDYSSFVAMQTSLPYEFQGINIGLYISTICHEQILATTPAELQAAMDSQHDVGRYFRLPFFGDARMLFNTCKVWGALPPAPGENDAVTSDIPALIIAGKYDPVTPPIFGKQVAANLSHSYTMEFPSQGHTPTAVDTSGCAFKTLLAFLDNPIFKPDMACLSAIKPVDFSMP